MKRLLSICLSLCIMVSVFVSFDITASAKTTMKKTTVSVSNTSSGVNVSWKKVSGAKSYKVYRKAPGAKKYSAVKSTNNKTVKYLDKKVSAGKTYSYQVVAVKGKETSKSKTKSITRLLAPKNLKIQSYASKTDCTIDYNAILNDKYDDDFPIFGVKVTWSKSSYANKYDIYRKQNKGKFEKLDTVGNRNSYIDMDALSGLTYQYKVVAKKNSSQSASTISRSMVYLSPATIVASPITSGMRISWESVEEGSGYKLYRSPNGKNGTYSLIGNFSKNKNTYVDKSANQLGKTYYYKIVVYKGSATSVGMTARIKYQGLKTVNVKAGSTDDSIKKSIEQFLKEYNKDAFEKITFKDVQKAIKITSLNSSVAKVSSDYVITGVTAGKTVKAKIQATEGKITEEVSFILINVK